MKNSITIAVFASFVKISFSNAVTYDSFFVDDRDTGLIQELGPTPVQTPSAEAALALCNLTFPASAPVSAAQWNAVDQTALCYNLLTVPKDSSCVPLISDPSFIFNTAVQNYDLITVSQGASRVWFPTKLTYGPGANDPSHALPVASNDVGDFYGPQFSDEFECRLQCESLGLAYDVYRTYLAQDPNGPACSCINALQNPVDNSNSFAFYVPNGNSLAIRYETTTWRFPRTVPSIGFKASPTFKTQILSDNPSASLAWAACRNDGLNGANRVQGVYWDGVSNEAVCFSVKNNNPIKTLLADSSSNHSIFILDNSVVSAVDQPYSTCVTSRQETGSLRRQ